MIGSSRRLESNSEDAGDRREASRRPLRHSFIRKSAFRGENLADRLPSFPDDDLGFLWRYWRAQGSPIKKHGCRRGTAEAKSSAGERIPGAAVTAAHSNPASTGAILDLRRTKPIQRTSFGFSLKGRKELATAPEMQTKGRAIVAIIEGR
jgi:hypothetical protein